MKEYIQWGYVRIRFPYGIKIYGDYIRIIVPYSLLSTSKQMVQSKGSRPKDLCWLRVLQESCKMEAPRIHGSFPKSGDLNIDPKIL